MLGWKWSNFIIRSESSACLYVMLSQRMMDRQYGRQTKRQTEREREWQRWKIQTDIQILRPQKNVPRLPPSPYSCNPPPTSLPWGQIHGNLLHGLSTINHSQLKNTVHHNRPEHIRHTYITTNHTVHSEIAKSQYTQNMHITQLIATHINPTHLVHYTYTKIYGWGTMLQAGRSRVRFPMRSLDFFFFQFT
jgi:hypothetical protein